jgi:hypothetical protein
MNLASLRVRSAKNRMTGEYYKNNNLLIPLDKVCFNPAETQFIGAYNINATNAEEASARSRVWRAIPRRRARRSHARLTALFIAGLRVLEDAATDDLAQVG